MRRTIRVRIPAGIEDGQTVRVRGEGIVGPSPEGPGDAFVLVRVQAPPRERAVVKLLSLAGLVVTLALMAKVAIG